MQWELRGETFNSDGEGQGVMAISFGHLVASPIGILENEFKLGNITA